MTRLFSNSVTFNAVYTSSPYSKNSVYLRMMIVQNDFNFMRNQKYFHTITTKTSSKCRVMMPGSSATVTHTSSPRAGQATFDSSCIAFFKKKKLIYLIEFFDMTYSAGTGNGNLVKNGKITKFYVKLRKKK